MSSKKIPKVAIITRTKDRKLLLKRALDSVKSQSYSDFVHVIVNDGGDKKSVDKIVGEYSHNIKVMHNTKSVGITPALNQGIQAVNTKYICILDDDDTWANDRLEKTVDHLEKSGDKAAVVKMDLVTEDVQGSVITKVSQETHPDSPEADVSLYKQCKRNYLSNGVVTYAREIYDELGGYDESLTTAEDWDFGIRILLKHDVGLVKTNHPLFFYHQRTSTSGVMANTVFSASNSQESQLNKIRNHYLRKDIKDGDFGVGYIINQLAYEEETLARLENHVNYNQIKTIENIKKMLDDTMLKKVQRRIQHTLRHKPHSKDS